LRIANALSLTLLAGSLACKGGVPARETSRSEQDDDAQRISLVQLVANPHQYHGRRVRVAGFCHLEFESQGLYIHRDDFGQMLLKNGVWLDLDPSPEQLLLSDHYVAVEGTFDAQRQGHLSMYSGVLTAVRRMDRVPTRAELQAMQ
jgi:hypothetical protein